MKTVVIRDYSCFCPLKCVNGGHYKYTTTYNKINDNEFEVVYSTSAEFPFCDKNSTFQDCTLCQGWDNEHNKCTIDYQKVSEETLKQIISDSMNNGRVEIEIDGEIVKTAIQHYKTKYCSVCGHEETDLNDDLDDKVIEWWEIE
jgi:hypothetical protein